MSRDDDKERERENARRQRRCSGCLLGIVGGSKVLDDEIGARRGAIEPARSRRRRRGGEGVARDNRGSRQSRGRASRVPGPLEAAGGSSRLLTCMPAIMTGLRVALEATFLDWVGLATTALRVDITMEFMLIVRWFRRCLLL